MSVSVELALWLHHHRLFKVYIIRIFLNKNRALKKVPYFFVLFIHKIFIMIISVFGYCLQP